MAADDHVMVSPDQLKWGAAPPAFPKGAQLAVISGDPPKEGLYVIRLKLPAGYKVAAHHHPHDENLTVISGQVKFGMGDKADESKTTAVKTGGFVKAPKGMNHFVFFPEETTLQVHGMGPQSLNYVNAADDPRKSN
jgi:quercetin dioxygenase-like cupin family protein